MEFGLSLEQRQFDESLREFLKDRLPMERLRALAEPGGGYDGALWNGLAELGLHGLMVPERFGGAGLAACWTPRSRPRGWLPPPRRCRSAGPTVMAPLAFVHSATASAAGRVSAVGSRR